MKYLVIDGLLHGTGIRDKNEGGYIKLDTLHLPDTLKIKIKSWLQKYEEEHYNSYSNAENINELDTLGVEIAKHIKSIVNSKVTYFSSATLKEIPRIFLAKSAKNVRNFGSDLIMVSFGIGL